MLTLSAMRVKLAQLDRRIEALQAASDKARLRSESATAGGLTDYDPAVLSGVRRKPNHKGNRRRFDAYDREAKATLELAEAVRKRDTLAAVIVRAERDAEAHRDIASLKPGDAVRDNNGWHRVARVNDKTVSVETGYSWTDRIAHDRIIETRAGAR